MTDTDRIRERSIAAVILAAGAGSRYAGDTHKLFAEVAGRPVISHVIDAARGAEVDEVIVVSIGGDECQQQCVLDHRLARTGASGQ